jgi:hypothetical protein
MIDHERWWVRVFFFEEATDSLSFLWVRRTAIGRSILKDGEPVSTVVGLYGESLR